VTVAESREIPPLPVSRIKLRLSGKLSRPRFQQDHPPGEHAERESGDQFGRGRDKIFLGLQGPVGEKLRQANRRKNGNLKGRRRRQGMEWCFFWLSIAGAFNPLNILPNYCSHKPFIRKYYLLNTQRDPFNG